jgi:hypothetical protein
MLYAVYGLHIEFYLVLVTGAKLPPKLRLNTHTLANLELPESTLIQYKNTVLYC